MALLSLGRKQEIAPPLLLTPIGYTKSVIHAASQSVGLMLCEAIGHDKPEDWDEFLRSELGKKFTQGIRDGLSHLLNKGMAS